jgi:hypothetical protein
MYQRWKINRYPRISDYVWESTPTEITAFYDPVWRAKIGDGRDTFTFNITNFNNDYNNVFNAGDKIEVLYGVNTSSLTPSEDYLLMQGTVKTYPTYIDNNTNSLKIEVTNYTELLMSALTFVKDESLTVPYFLKRAIERTNFFDSQFSLTWHPDNKMTKRDGTAFPLVKEQWTYKSLMMLFEKYSVSTYTEDGNYYFYVDKYNRLVWKPRTATIITTFDSSVDNYKSLKVEDNPNVINFVVMKGGTLPSGGTVTAYVDNAASRVRDGFKPRVIISNVNTAQNLVNQDLGESATSRYPLSDSFPFETTWISSLTSSDAPACTVNSIVTIPSSSSYEDEKEWYNNAIQREIKYQLKSEGRAIVTNKGVRKTQITVEFEPGKNWGLGDIVRCTIPERGLSVDLRVNSVEITDTEKYVLLKDEGT